MVRKDIVEHAKQVAVEAGVSVSTVSKVINGRYGIAEDTAAHVNADA